MQKSKKPKTRRAVWIAIVVILVVIGAAAILLLLHREPRYQRAYQKGKLQLDGSNPKEAIASFRDALKMKSDFLDAQIGVIRSFTELKEFDKAFVEIDAACQMDLSEGEAAQLRARVHHAAAKQRMIAAGTAVTDEFYDELIRDHIAPAIEGLVAHADSSERPTTAYTLLGHMYRQMSLALGRKLNLLTNDRDVALGIEQTEKARAIEKQMVMTDNQARASQLAMLGAYKKAIENDPDTIDARVAIAEHLLLLTPPKSEAAREHLVPLLQTAPNNMKVLGLMARIEQLAGNDNAALGYIRSLRKQLPENAVLQVMELNILMDSGLWAEAGPLAETLAGQHPNDPETAYLHGRWLLHQGNTAESEKSLQNAVLQETARLGPRDRFWRPQACKLFGDVLVTNNKPAQAINAYKQSIRTINKSYRPGTPRSLISDDFRNLLYECYKALSRETLAEDPESATTYAMSAFEVFPDRTEAYENARNAFAETDQNDQVLNLALMHVEAIAQTQGNEAGISACQKQMELLDSPASLRMLKANLLTREGSYREALEALDRLRQDFPGDLKYAQALALVHMSLNQDVEARTIFERLYETNSQDADILRMLLKLQVRTGQMDKARDLLTKADNTLGADETRNALLDLALSEGQADTAVLLAQDYVNSDSQNVVAHSILAELLWQTGQLDKARASFDRALALDPEHLPVYRRGLMDMQEGKFQSAVDFFSAAVDRHPQMSIPLAVALASNDQMGQATKTLENLGLSNLGPNARLDIPRWIFTLLLTAQNRTEAATSQNQRIISATLGYVVDRQALLDRLAQLAPATRQDATSTLSRFCLFAENRCPAAARSELAHMTDLMPNEPLPLCWQAAAMAKEGKYEESIKLFENLISNSPHLIIARIMLAEAHAQENNYDLAVTVLQDAISVVQQQNAPLLYLKLATFQEKLGRLDAAIESYKRAMEHPFAEAQACNQVALLLATSKNSPSKALPYAERAFELLPNSAAVEDTLGWVLLLHGDTEKAIAHIERAKMLQPQHPSVRFHLAKAYLKARRPAEAKTELQEALAISRSFPEAKETAKLLSEL